jgi:hypothetical protein
VELYAAAQKPEVKSPALSLFGGIGLDLMAAISAPHDEANAPSS